MALKNRSSYWLLLPLIRPQIGTILLGFAGTLGFTVCWPILISLAQNMAKYISVGDLKAIVSLAGAAAILFLVRGAAQYIQDSMMAEAALQVSLNVRQTTYAHIQKLSLNYFEMAKTGDLSYRLTEDVDRIGEVVNKFFHDFIPSALQLIVVLGWMVYVNWQLTVAVLVIAPFMGLLITAFGAKMLQFSRRSQNQLSNLSSLLTEIFGGIRLVKAFAAEEYQLDIFRQEAEENRRALYRTEQLKAMQFVVVGFLEAMSIIFLLFLAGWQISQKNLTGNELVGYLVAVAMLIDPIAHITNNYNQFKQGEASINRIFELLQLRPTILDHPNAIALPPVRGKVEYQGVTFAYQSDKPVLQDINLTALPGEMIALVGASGAGKTTLVNLLLRFYNLDEGEILIDGTNIQDVTIKSLRQQMGIVLQENILFSGTIAQNIAFGKTDVNQGEIESAAKIANAHRFISELSQGYHTYVGERGVNLSGGQRQRIAIARAVLREPKILILDEATSALDSESEALVQEALERIMTQRTTFVIAHRLATVRRADRIIVLEQGKIIESGTHEELLAYNGRYAKFHAQQFQK